MLSRNDNRAPWTFSATGEQVEPFASEKLRRIQRNGRASGIACERKVAPDSCAWHPLLGLMLVFAVLGEGFEARFGRRFAVRMLHCIAAVDIGDMYRKALLALFFDREELAEKAP